MKGLYREKCPPDLLLEAYSINSVTNDQKNSISAHCEQCSDCQQKLETIEQERSEFTKRNPLPRIEDLSPVLGIPNWRIISVRIAPIMALLLIAIFFFSPSPRNDNYIAMKGSFNIKLYITRNNHTFIGSDGVYFSGDKLQFAVLSDEPVYLYIINIDQSGKTSVYYPDIDTPQIPIRNNQQTFLPVSITLDDYIGLERIFVFTSQNEINVLSLIERISTITNLTSLELFDKRERIEGLQRSYLITKTN